MSSLAANSGSSACALCSLSIAFIGVSVFLVSSIMSFDYHRFDLRGTVYSWLFSVGFYDLLMQLFSCWWIGLTGGAFLSVVYLVTSLHDVLPAPQYRSRRVMLVPDRGRRLSSKRKRKWRRIYEGWRRAFEADYAAKLAERMTRLELEEFLTPLPVRSQYQVEFSTWFIDLCVAQFMDDWFPASAATRVPVSPSVDEGGIDDLPLHDGFDSAAPPIFTLDELDNDTLNHFVSVELGDPTKILKLYQGAALYDHKANVRAALLRANAVKLAGYHLRFANANLRQPGQIVDPAVRGEGRSRDYYVTPGILDTGASFGLTPFREDFITYQKVDISVKDVSSTNKVIGMGTVMYRFQATNGDTIYLPTLAYHLPTTDIRLISPQAYHQQYGGHSVVTADSFELHLPKPCGHQRGHVLHIPMDSGTNLPMAFDVACSIKEQKEIGPKFSTSVKFLQRVEGPFFGSWKTTRLETEDHSRPTEVDYEFGLFKHTHVLRKPGFAHPCVTADENGNLSVAQKEVLLWHAKLNCSMTKIQSLMKSHVRVDENGQSTLYPPVIPTKHASAADCTHPMCATCQLARAKARKPKSDKHHRVKKKEHALSRGKYKPGDFVSLDTVIVPIRGRSVSGTGATDSSDQFTCATIFHDAGSGVIRVYPQVSAAASETLLSKAKFEDFLWVEAGVRVKHYHSDQGVFVSKQFRDACSKKKQGQSFSGASAKHQNSLAERSVQTIFWMARHMMLHAALRWATHGADDPRLWPQAVEYSVYLFNRTPSLGSGCSPLERLTQRKSDHKDLLRCHVFGAPVYVLDPRLGDGQKIPKFDKRARVGQFLGFSEEHSSTVGLVRNLVTGRITSQYHCVFDDKFETVTGLFGSQDTPEEPLNAAVESIWNGLFTSEGSRDCYIDPEFDPATDELIFDVPPLEEEWLSEDELRDREERLQEMDLRVRQQKEKYESQFPKLETPDQKVTIRFKDEPDVSDDVSVSSDVPLQEHLPGSSEGELGTVDSDQKEVSSILKSTEPIVVDDVSPDAVEETTWSKRRLRSKRTSWKDRVLISAKNWHAAFTFTPYQLAALTPEEKRVLRDSGRFDHLHLTLSSHTTPIEVRRATAKKLRNRQKWTRRREVAEQHLRAMQFNISTVDELMDSPLSQYIKLASNDCIYNGPRTTMVCQDVHPLFLSAKTGISREDNPSWKEAMSGDEAEQYWEAAKSEIATLENMQAWEVVDKSTVPKGQRILPSLWVFKRKRNPDGTVRKYKGRLTVRGDQQLEGVDFNETWAPVCAWSTVRLLFNLQCCLGLKSASADVSCAFLHAPLDEGEQVFVSMPQGFEEEGKCLKLRQSLYGLKQAPRNFWKYLTETMEKCGMKQSPHDPCLFIGEKVIAVAYVDDILFWSKEDSHITDLMKQLRDSGLLLEKESTAAGFLGVDIKTLETDEDGRTTKMELTQTGLIDRIITNLGLDGKEHYGKFTPAEAKPLTKDPDGEPCQEDFNFAAVVGQLLYLSGHSRPELAYAVNCVARYMFCPKRSHELALIRIGKYLKATRNKGLIITPSENALAIDCYPDADFGGLWSHERPDDPACVKSRTGFVILAANCPIVWKSTLQSKTALSTMEAEITALAHCCKELFPILELAKT